MALITTDPGSMRQNLGNYVQRFGKLCSRPLVVKKHNAHISLVGNFITCAKEVMFLPLCVCLLASCRRNFNEFFWRSVTVNKDFKDFSADADLDADT